MDNLYWFLALILTIIVLGGLNLFQVIFHYKEKEDIFAKFMARDLRESEYFKKEYPGVIKEGQKKMEEERKTKLTAEEIVAKAAADNL